MTSESKINIIKSELIQLLNKIELGKIKTFYITYDGKTIEVVTHSN